MHPVNERLWITYRHDLIIRQLSPNTITNYCYSLTDADAVLQKPFTAATRLDLKAYLAACTTRLSDTTVHMRWVVLKIFYNFLIKEELIDSNPMDGIDEPKVADNPVRIVPDADLKKLLAVCNGRTFRDRRDTALIRLMLEPGAPRRSEITAMQTQDIDITNEIITIHGKGNRIRYITYGPKTGQALLRYLHMRDSHKHAEAPNLWLGRFGAFSLYAVGQVLEARCKQAGIEKINPHALRHKAADKAMSAGISDLDMQTLFGWRSHRMLEVYARSNRTARALASSKAKSPTNDL